MKIKHTMYLHGCKDKNWDIWEKELKQDPNTEAARMFRYALTEVKFLVETDTETGEVVILQCDGKELK